MPEGNFVFENKWKKVKPVVAGFFYRRGCPRDDTLDLIQETGIAAWKNYESLDGDFKAWVIGIAKNIYKRYLRDQKRNPGTDPETAILDESPGPEENTITNFMLAHCLSELDEIDRKCLVLHDFHGYKFKEIGEKLGISRSNAHYHIERARKHLQNRFPELMMTKQDGREKYERVKHIQGLPHLN